MIVAFLFHIAVATLVAYLLASIVGALTPIISLISLVIGAGAGYYAYRTPVSDLQDVRLLKFSRGVHGGLERALMIFLGYAGFRHFLWMIYESAGEIKTLSVNNFGDLPLHINYIRQLSNGAKFPPVNPEFASEVLRYPFGVDLYSALWETLHVPIGSHFFAVGFALMLASLAALRAYGGWLAVGGLFLNGGILVLHSLGNTLPVDVESSLGWKNIFLTVFVTQRGVLFAIPVGVLLLHLLQRLSEKKNFTLSKSDSIVCGVMWGSLALFHLHTFFAVSLLLLAIAAVHKKEGLKFFAKLLVPAMPVGTFFTLYSTGFLRKASVMHWDLGWLADRGQFLSFAALNFGIWPLFFLSILGLAIYTFRKTRTDESKNLLFVYVIAATFFALFLNLMFAPWAWDNIKVLIWPYIVLLAVSERVLALHFSEGNRAYANIALAVLLLAPGADRVAQTLVGTRGATSIYNFTELIKTDGVLADLRHTGAGPNAVIAAAPIHNHALSWFGVIRPVGYDGHLWSHGIDYGKETQDLKALMTAATGWKEAASRLGATHIFWGPTEALTYGDLPSVFDLELKNISSVQGYKIYELPRQ